MPLALAFSGCTLYLYLGGLVMDKDYIQYESIYNKKVYFLFTYSYFKSLKCIPRPADLLFVINPAQDLAAQCIYWQQCNGIQNCILRCPQLYQKFKR